MAVEILLVKSVDHIGYAGEIVSVKPGYFRNYLYPKHLAIRATRENVSKYQEKVHLLQKNNEAREASLRKVVSQIGDRKLLFVRSSTQGNRLHGTVTKPDICNELSKLGVEVNPKDVVFREKIRGFGQYLVGIKLFRKETIQFNIAIIGSLNDIKLRESRGFIVADNDGILKSVKDLINEAVSPLDNRLRSLESRLDEFQSSTSTSFNLIRVDVKSSKEELDHSIQSVDKKLDRVSESNNSKLDTIIQHLGFK